MVKEVEGIDAELEHQPLGDLRVLIERHIEVGEARSASPSRISPTTPTISLIESGASRPLDCEYSS